MCRATLLYSPGVEMRFLLVSAKYFSNALGWRRLASTNSNYHVDNASAAVSNALVNGQCDASMNQLYTKTIHLSPLPMTTTISPKVGLWSKGTSKHS